MLDLIKREPVRVYSLVIAVLTVLATFGIDLSADQRAAILAVAAIVLGVGSQTVRANVAPVAGPNYGEGPPDP